MVCAGRLRRLQCESDNSPKIGRRYMDRLVPVLEIWWTLSPYANAIMKSQGDKWDGDKVAKFEDRGFFIGRKHHAIFCHELNDT